MNTPLLCRARVLLRCTAYGRLALFALSLTSCSPDTERLSDRKNVRSSPAAKETSEGPLVVFLGDSISAGFGLARSEAFPSLLQARLAEQGTSFRLVNSGVSGATTAGGLSRLDWLLKQKPDLLVLELGANDALRGQPLGTIEENLRTIVRRTREAGCSVLLLGMRIPPSYGGTYAQGFAAVYARLEKELELPAVQFFMKGVAGVPRLNLADGLHPTAEGHEILARNLLPTFEKVLAELDKRD